MKNENKRLFLQVLLLAVLLFIVNNIFLSRIVTYTAGGSLIGATTVTALTIIALYVKRAWAIAEMYLIYGLIGMISHILVGDFTYIIIILIIVVLASFYGVLFRWMKYKFYIWLITLPIFALIMKIVPIIIIQGDAPSDWQGILMMFIKLLPGQCIGVGIGVILYFLQKKLLNRSRSEH